MTLPFFWLSLGTSAGILFARAYPFFEHGVRGAFGFGILCLWFARGRKIFLPFLIFAAAVLGYLYASTQNARPSHAVENFASSPESGEAFVRQRWITLKGLVETLPEIKKTGRKVNVSFVLSSKSLRNYGKENPASGKVQVFMGQPQTIPDVGDLVELRGILKKPLPKLNPGSFDYGYYLSQSGIYSIFTGYGKNCIQVQAKGQSHFLVRWISKLRKRIVAILDSRFPPDEAALFKAMILGLRKGISTDLRSEYFKTGTSHLLAISGLNVALVAGSIYLFVIAFGFNQNLIFGTDVFYPYQK